MKKDSFLVSFFVFLFLLVIVFFPSGILAFTDGQAATDLLGQYDDSVTNPQPDFTKATLNGVPNIFGYSAPKAVTYDSVNHRLFVSDTSNHRILVYNLTAGNLLIDHVPDYVLGQSDFHTNTAATTAGGLRNPSKMAYDSGANRLCC